MFALRKSHKRMETQGSLSGSLPQLLKALFGLELWNLKDFCFVYASERSIFKPHKGIQLNNSNYSHSFHMIIFRHATYVIGNVSCCKPKIDRKFHSNPPMNKLGFVDVFLDKSGFFWRNKKESSLEVLIIHLDTKLDCSIGVIKLLEICCAQLK